MKPGRGLKMLSSGMSHDVLGPVDGPLERRVDVVTDLDQFSNHF